MEEPIVVKPYTTTQLAKLYDTTVSTLDRDLKPHRQKLGKKIGQYWNIWQVELIFGLLGRP